MSRGEELRRLVRHAIEAGYVFIPGERGNASAFVMMPGRGVEFRTLRVANPKGEREPALEEALSSFDRDELVWELIRQGNEPVVSLAASGCLGAQFKAHPAS